MKDATGRPLTGVTRILKPVSEVFDAVVDPNKMSNYFISGLPEARRKTASIFCDCVRISHCCSCVRLTQPILPGTHWHLLLIHHRGIAVTERVEAAALDLQPLKQRIPDDVRNEDPSLWIVSRQEFDPVQSQSVSSCQYGSKSSLRFVLNSDRPPIQAPHVKTRGTRTVQPKDAP